MFNVLRSGDRVKCTKHDGKHKGCVSRVIQSGVMYVISWDGEGKQPVRIGNTTLLYPVEIVKHHLFDITACEASSIERA